LEARAEIQVLALRLADGDSGAIAPAFTVLWPLVLRFSARALPSVADAEDVAQAALIKFFEQVEGFDPAQDALGWVMTITAFECRTLLRKIGRRREMPDAVAALKLAADGTPEELVIERDLEAAVRDILGTLREDDVRAILAGIADTRDEHTRGTAFRKRLQRAFERLRLAWRTKHGT
jgi:RNA polymerase sigma factor (sigma-70 family)